MGFRHLNPFGSCEKPSPGSRGIPGTLFLLELGLCPKFRFDSETSISSNQKQNHFFRWRESETRNPSLAPQGAGVALKLSPSSPSSDRTESSADRLHNSRQESPLLAPKRNTAKENTQTKSQTHIATRLSVLWYPLIGSAKQGQHVNDSCFTDHKKII